MKRGWTILLAGVLILAIALPATAKKPTPPTTTTTTPPTTTTTTTTIPAAVEAAVDCQFDEVGEGWILQNWWSEDQSEPYRCRWETSNRGPFTFHLLASSGEGSVLRPHLFVTDAYAYPHGDRCFDALDNGWHPLSDDLNSSYAWEEFTLPDDGECDDSFPYPDPDGGDVFSLVIAARVKGTTPVVTVTQE